MRLSFLEKIYYCMFILGLCISNLDNGHNEIVAPRVRHKTSNPINRDRLVVHMLTSNSIFEEAKTYDIVYHVLKKSLEQPQSSDEACKNTNPKILIVTVERRIIISDPALQKNTGIARYRQRI